MEHLTTFIYILIFLTGVAQENGSGSNKQPAEVEIQPADDTASKELTLNKEVTNEGNVSYFTIICYQTIFKDIDIIWILTNSSLLNVWDEGTKNTNVYNTFNQPNDKPIQPQICRAGYNNEGRFEVFDWSFRLFFMLHVANLLCKCLLQYRKPKNGFESNFRGLWKPISSHDA